MSVIGSNILAGASGQAVGYQVERSLRFNSSDSAFCSRTPSSTGDRKKWTWSGWVKRSALSVDQSLFSAYTGSASDEAYTDFFFSSDNTLRLAGWFTTWRTTTQVFRDASAWYHIVLTVDIANATANDRIKIYVNGSQITTFNTTNNPATTSQFAINSTSAHNLGANAYYANTTNKFSGYLAECHFCDGYAYDASYFGETNSVTGQWIPKTFSGSYGPQGWKLTFSDNSNTTATTLGKDTSGNGNDWTPTNFSVTAGAGNDVLCDTPTSYGTDDSLGGSVRGNYATFNNLLNTSGSYANGNLERTQSDNFGALSTICPSSGKWYAEFVYTTIGSAAVGAVVSNRIASDGANGLGQTWQLGSDHRGFLYNAGSSTSVSSYTTNDVIGLAFDCSTGAASFYKNGTLLGTITNAAFANVPVGIGVATGGAPGSNTVVANYGQRPWAYTPPANHRPIVDTCLPVPVVAKPNSVFDVLLWTGTSTSSARTVSGLNFSPELVWSKARSQPYNHQLWDVVRGTGKELVSNSTAAELTNNQYGYLSAFNSDGFTATPGSTDNGFFNETNTTYAAWCWDAGSSNTTNTSGTITSTVRVNATSGCAVVSYTGNGSNGASVGHSLGVTPALLIIKNRDSTNPWIVHHDSFTNHSLNYLLLNSTDAVTNNPTAWLAKSSTLITWTNTTGGTNTNGNKYIMYAFAPVAGYSSFGSYTGNGSADGPFVFTGMRPRWILIKNASAAQGWCLIDTARATYNLVDTYLSPNSSSGDLSGYAKLDILSNGFKVRETDTFINGNTNTLVYAAFAENPFQYARAR